jgi:hypothetical protein
LFLEKVVTIIKITNNASSIFDKSCYATKAKAMNKGALSYPSFVGSKQRHLMEKEATPKCKGLKTKTSNEKRGNPKMQGAQNKNLR